MATEYEKVSPSGVQSRQIKERDWRYIADYIAEEWSQRCERRRHLNADWGEIDRQVAMTPDIKYKLDPTTGEIREGWEWLPELEPPYQAQALEVLTADARRFQGTGQTPWFKAHVALTDDYLERADMRSWIAGDKNDVPAVMDQDGADQMVHGLISHWHRQYDFPGNLDQINAEAFSYGMGVGRVRCITKTVFRDRAQGIVKETQRIPVLLPKSIQNIYPDDTVHSVFMEGERVGQGVIACWTQKLADLQMAARKGSTDPNSEYGGWMPGRLGKLEADEKGNVTVLEWEGDLVIPRTTRESMFIPNVCVTVAIGKKEQGKSEPRVFRLRFNKHVQSSYVLFPYHRENGVDFYPTSPLMKGRPLQVQIAVVSIRLLMMAALKAQPPASYNRDDPVMAAQGGPNIFPGATNGSIDPIEFLDIGDTGPLTQQLLAYIQQYADIVGISAPRLGAQTVSHTTAFAKETEIQRGMVRTVDYTDSSLRGALQQYLTLAYEMGKPQFKDGTQFYVPAYQAFAELDKDQLPDMVEFEAVGASGPQDAMDKMQRKFMALNQAAQLDQLAVALGQPPTIDYPAAAKALLSEGGWTDIDTITNGQDAPAGVAGDPGMAGGAGAPEGGTAVAALQGLSFGGG